MPILEATASQGMNLQHSSEALAFNNQSVCLGEGQNGKLPDTSLHLLWSSQHNLYLWEASEVTALASFERCKGPGDGSQKTESGLDAGRSIMPILVPWEETGVVGMLASCSKNKA